jgi:acid stress-induced BolA-like protein IbaG/YrbA
MKLKVASEPSPSDIITAVRSAIESAIDNSRAEVTGGGGHYSLVVTAPVFAGTSRLESQRLVLRAIKELMAGDHAPVHAVDSLITKTE